MELTMFATRVLNVWSGSNAHTRHAWRVDFKMSHSYALIRLTCIIAVLPFSRSLLYPQDSETRETKELSGIWNFRVTHPLDQEEGFREKWFSKPLLESGNVIPMPVPSSYNDITQNETIRDHVGWAWYDTTFFPPKQSTTDNLRTFLRFGSVHYQAIVWLNGAQLVTHSGGHLPFEVEVSRQLIFGNTNLLTVAVNNILTNETIPQGTVLEKPAPVFLMQDYTFDFYNYAGIHRPVVLYTTPLAYVKDITLHTFTEDNNIGRILYDINAEGLQHNLNASCKVSLYDKRGSIVAEQKLKAGELIVKNANFWWPYKMHSQPGYLYTLTVKLESEGKLLDIYRLKVGIRSVSWTDRSLLINKRPFYFHGFGKHEDINIIGRGLSLPDIIKDFNLIKWIGANSFRTSHYPYAEEILDRADEEGIVIIDESPAVNLDNFDDQLLITHMRVLDELYQRDKNRPSVVMWSLANEPRSQRKASKLYFKKLVQHMRKLDDVRPITAVLNRQLNEDQAAQYLDVIGLNRYFGWYEEPGQLRLIESKVISEYNEWFKTFKKPIFISEYGAGAVTGLHSDPSVMFTEDYQISLMLEHFKAFDSLRKQGFFIGEMIWNFADFMTKQDVRRVAGNRKGMFTRNRQPKMAAHALRGRYWKLEQLTENCISFPLDQ